MLFFTLVLATGSAAAIAIGFNQRKPQSLLLIDALIDEQPKVAMLLPPEQVQTALTRTRQLAQDLLVDTRQQYQAALHNPTAVAVAQRGEQDERQNLLIGAVGLAAATAGVFLTPLFYLPSIFCTLYITRQFCMEAYQLLVKERRFNYRVVVALMTPAVLAGGFIWPAAFGMALGLINKYLVAKTEHRAKRHVADLFGS